MELSAEELAKIPTEALVAQAWRYGILDWKFKPIQKRLSAALASVKGKLFVAVIARQTGKTFWAASVAIEKALATRGARIKYGAAFQSELLEYIIPTFNRVLEDCPKDVRPQYKQQGTKFVFKNGSEIKLVGLDRHPDGLRGNVIDLIILDECGFIDNLDYLYKSVIVPTTRHRPNCKIILISTPPESPDHDFTEYALRAEAEGNYFLATIYDDETCKPETIEDLKKECGGEASTNWRREFLCQFVVDSDLAVIPEWTDATARALDRDEFYPYYHRYTAMDLGVVDFTAILFAYYDFKKACLVVEDETQIRGPEMTTDKLALLIKQKEFENWGTSKVRLRIADNNNLLLLNDLSAMHALPVMATNKDELPAMINEVRMLVKQGRLIVHPKCKMLLGCLKYGIYNDSKIKREFARSKVYGHYDHLAALVYLVRNLDQNTNPIPNNYGISARNHWINPSQTKQEQAWSGLANKKFVTNRKAN